MPHTINPPDLVISTSGPIKRHILWYVGS